MGISAIIDGHVKEALKQNNSLSERRLAVCKTCPIYTETSVLGPICNSRICYNQKTGEIRQTRGDGFKCGCGCRLRAKTRLNYAKCPIGKW